jgi:hypothetical protein
MEISSYYKPNRRHRVRGENFFMPTSQMQYIFSGPPLPRDHLQAFSTENQRSSSQNHEDYVSKQTCILVNKLAPQTFGHAQTMPK